MNKSFFAPKILETQQHKTNVIVRPGNRRESIVCSQAI